MKVLVTAPIKRFPKVIKELNSFSDLTIKEYLDQKKLIQQHSLCMLEYQNFISQGVLN